MAFVEATPTLTFTFINLLDRSSKLHSWSSANNISGLLLRNLVEKAAWGDLRCPDPQRWYSEDHAALGLHSALWLWTLIRPAVFVCRPPRGCCVPLWLGSVTQVPLLSQRRHCFMLFRHVRGARSDSFQEFYSGSAWNLLLHVTLKVALQ